MTRGIEERTTRFLRWSERYTRTDMVYLAHGGFWLAIAYAVATISGLITAVALANFIPKEVYGTYQFVLSGAAIIASLTLTGMNSAVIRAVSQGSDSALRRGTHIRLIWSTAAAFIAAAVALYYYLNGDTTLALSFLIAGSLAPFIDTFSLARSHLIGKKLFRENALFGIARRLIPLVAIVGALYLTDDIVLLILVYFLSHAAVVGFLYYFMVRFYALPIAEEPEMVNLATHLSLMRFFTEISSQADKVLMYHFLGPSALASYALAQLPATHIRGGCKLILSLTFPKLSVIDLPRLKQRLPFTFMIFFLASAGVVILYLLLAPFLFALLFPAYSESVLPSQMLALLALGTPRLLLSQALTIHQKKGGLYLISISQNTLRLILLGALLPWYGIWGAVWALLGTQVYGVIITAYVFFKSDVTA